MSEITKFESDMSQTSKDIASQNWENLQTFEWWASLSPLPPPPPTHKHLYNFATLRSCIFVSFEQITFKLSNFINLTALFIGELRDFP